jgi:PAS domain S-box-containing protein
MPRIEEADRSFVFPGGVGAYEWRIAEDAIGWSRTLLDVFGIEEAPSDVSALLALVHPGDRHQMFDERILRPGNADGYEREFRILRPTGEIRFLHDKGTVERDLSGRAVTLRGILIDVTAMRSPSRHGPAVAHFDALADNISQLAWIADGDGWIYWYNKRWFDYTGTTLDQMAGWGWKTVHHPDHVERVVSKISASFQSGEPWEDSFPLRGVDGSYRWFLSRALPIRDAAGNILCWFGTNTDITEQRDTAQRLRDSRERFSALADAMPQLVWTADGDGLVDYCNSRLRHYDASGGETPRARVLLHEDDLAPTLEAWQAAVASRSLYVFSHRLRMADGSYRWHLSRAVPVASPETGELRWFGTATDIHDLKQAQEHRQLLVEELNHRVKNTLALVQVLAQQSFREDAADSFQFDAFIARLKALGEAHELLTRENWQEVSFRELVAGVAHSFGLEEGRIALRGEPLTIKARAAVTLTMAIHELCTNAMKYGALSVTGGRVSLAWDRLAQPPRAVRIVWREEGGPPVIPPSREGFGTRLIKRALAAELSGTVGMSFGTEGLECVMEGQL